MKAKRSDKIGPIPCSKCNEITERPRRGLCKYCYEKEWRETNREKYNQTGRAWYRKNITKARKNSLTNAKKYQASLTPEQRKSMYRRAYLRTTSEARTKDRQRAHEHYVLHPERYAFLRKQWATNNRERVKSYSEKRRALKRGVESDLTPAQWLAILEAYKHRCAYCGKHFDRLTQDHVIPLSKGGKHTASNIVPACQPCNSKKAAGLPLKPVQTVLL